MISILLLLWFEFSWLEVLFFQHHQFRFNIFYRAGGCRAQWKLHPTKLSTCAGSRVWSTLCTCFTISSFQEWEEAKPKNLHADFPFFKTLQTQTNSDCFLSAPVRFSQSDRAASELVNPSSKDVERFPSHSFSFLIFQPFLPGLLRCFLHVWFIPHQ